jgi:hypothetical protein
MKLEQRRAGGERKHIEKDQNRSAAQLSAGKNQSSHRAMSCGRRLLTQQLSPAQDCGPERSWGTNQKLPVGCRELRPHERGRTAPLVLSASEENEPKPQIWWKNRKGTRGNGNKINYFIKIEQDSHIIMKVTVLSPSFEY